MNTPHEHIDALNGAYHLSIHGNSAEGKEQAEKEFYACHDWLRMHKVKFHLKPIGTWVIDDEKVLRS
jgi:hypothetical protein